MKKIFFVVALFFLFGKTDAQSVQLYYNNHDTVYVDPGSTFSIQMRVKDFTAIGTLQMTLQWDTDHIQLNNFQPGALADMVLNDNPGQLLAIWTDVTGLGQTLIDSTVILNLSFTAASNWPDTTAVTFGTTPLSLELNRVDGNDLVALEEIGNPCMIVIRQCQTNILLPKDSTCLYQHPTLLSPVCQQCLSLLWNDSLSGPTFEVEQTGWLRVAAKGPWDCKAQDSMFIAPVPTLSLVVKDYHGFPVSCADATDALLAAQSDATHFLWSTGGQQPFLTNQAAGSYSLTVTNVYGCTAVEDTLLAAPPPLQVFLSAQSPTCPGLLNGAIQLTMTGGVAPYMLHDSAFAGVFLQLDQLSAGIYSLPLKDANGCLLDTFVLLTSPVAYQPMALLLQQPCYNQSNGVLQLEGLPPALVNLALNGSTIPPQTILNGIDAGSKQFIATDTAGCTYEWAFQVPALPEQFIHLGPDQNLPSGTPVQLTISPWAGLQIADLALHWSSQTSLSCTDCADPAFILVENTQVVLSATTPEGCMSYDTIVLKVNDQSFYFPNVFAPGVPGDNGIFLISGSSGQTTEIAALEIFDRWGSLVFSRHNFSPNDPSAAWDGTCRGIDCPSGVYIWRASLANSTNMSGDITLLR